MKTGTKEWSEHSKNILLGCSHDCKYCYAREQAERFKRLKDRRWKDPIVNSRALLETPRKLNGVIMFPTTHDILPEFLAESLLWISSWLEAGNEILVVSKPHFECIKEICDSKRIMAHKDRLTFRFTIGSMNDAILEFWEPGAPCFAERLCCLIYAFHKGYKTSVSMEPFLDPFVPNTVVTVEEFVTDTIWIGKMNNISRRVKTEGWTQGQLYYLDLVRGCQNDASILDLYKQLGGDKKIRWKDSIKKVLLKEGITIDH